MKLFDFTADKNKLSSQITESISVNEEESVNESLQALAKHVKEGTALCDSPFRHGSKAYIETFQLAKKLREAGSLPELDWESEEMLATDIGEQVTLKGGEKVWLDIPYLIEDEDNGMIGEPDDYYDAEERQEAYDDLQDALQGNYMDDYIKDGVCPACGGNGYMDGEEEMYNDETDEYEEGLECDGFGRYGCDQGEMTGASWVDIVQHDERKADRQKSKDEYPGDEEVIKQVASYMKRMDDPRLAYQQMQADFPHMGRGQRSEILGKASKLAFGENINEGEERSIIQSACIEKLVDEFAGEERQFKNKDDMEYAIYQELERLDVADCVDPDMEVGGQPIGNFASGRVIDVVNSGDVIYDVMQMMDHSQFNEGLLDMDWKSARELDDLPMIKSYNTPEENAVGKILGRALMKKDWSKYSPQELFSELESENPELADDIAKIAKIVYKVQLEEGKSPHKKGTKKYKKHMAAMHAGESVTNEALSANMQNMFDELRIDDNTYIEDNGKEITLADVGTGYWLLGYDRDGSCFEMSKMSQEQAKDSITGFGEYKVSDADITDFDGARYYWNENMADSGVLHIKKGVNEAEYNGKKVKLNKPMRSSGGGKKYKVYVKNPKTGRVKKISFGDAGLKTKSSNKKRAKSFAARHNCEKKNDKMKAGYWACRLPRYGLVKGGKWW